MKITYVGNYQIDFTTENHIAKTLESMGHEVVRIQEQPNARPGWVSEVTLDTDLFLFTRTWGKMVTLNDLAYLKQKGIPTASYHLDLYVGLSRQSGIESDPFWRTEYVFSADGDPESQKFFESKGINHHWLLPGVFDEESVMLPPNNDKSLSGDVIFVGGGAEYGHPEWPYRHELVKFLERTYGERYRKYGHPQRTVRGLELNQLYANSKVAVGDTVNIDFKHTNYTSDRLFESIGRGGFTIYPDLKGITDIFPASLRGMFYEHGNFEDLEKRIDYYLSHDSEREALRREAFAFVNASQTYSKRLSELLERLEYLGAFKNSKSRTDDATRELPILEGHNVPEEKGTFINLGSGADPAPGWINVDVVDLPEVDVVHNLIKFPYPFEDGSADGIKAVDVLEHLPNYIGDKNGVIAFIEECHRILKPGGTLYLQTPGWKAEFLWIDPTHVRGFDIQSMDFFDPTTHYGKTTGFYSKCKFKVRAEELENHNLRFWMEKI